MSENEKLVERLTERAGHGLYPTEMQFREAAAALTAAEARIKALSEALELIARPTSPERLSGAHLTDDGRGQLAFAMIDNFQAKARQALSTLGGNADDR